MSSTCDYTMYSFEGEKMGKARLVLALVKRYVSDNPSLMFRELQAAFPDCLHTDTPNPVSRTQCVLMRLGDIPEASRHRFLCAEQDRVRVGDDVVLVSREWNGQNIRNVLARAEQFGYVPQA
jgi:hypothetical protein